MLKGDFVEDSEGNKEKEKAPVVLKTHKWSLTESWWKYKIKANNKKKSCFLL